MTEKQWDGLALAILSGVAQGTERAGLVWASDLGVTAVQAVRARMDELWAEQEGASGE